MMSKIKKVHGDVLEAINEEDYRVGIAYYRRYAKVYESLPRSEAIFYWRSVLRAVERKIGASHTFVRMEGRKVKDIFSMSKKELEKMIEESRTLYKKDENLNAKIVDYLLTAYQETREMIDNLDDILPTKIISPD